MRGIRVGTGARWLRTVACCCLWWRNLSRDYKTARPKIQQQVNNSLSHFPRHSPRTARCEINAVDAAELPLQRCATRHDAKLANLGPQHPVRYNDLMTQNIRCDKSLLPLSTHQQIPNIVFYCTSHSTSTVNMNASPLSFNRTLLC